MFVADLGVYTRNRNFRLVYSSKIGKDSILKPSRAHCYLERNGMQNQNEDKQAILKAEEAIKSENKKKDWKNDETEERSDKGVAIKEEVGIKKDDRTEVDTTEEEQMVKGNTRIASKEIKQEKDQKQDQREIMSYELFLNSLVCNVDGREDRLLHCEPEV